MAPKGRRICRIIFRAGLAVLPATVAEAQLPLSIDALLVSERRLTATLGASGGSYREPVLLGSAASPQLRWRESAAAAGSIGLRYGIGPHLELNGTLVRSEFRWDLDALAAGRDRGERLVVGANWLAASGAMGSLLLDARIDALSRAPGGSHWSRAAGGSIGATGYRMLDPVVLALATRFRREGARDTAAGAFRPGDRVAVDASVNFAVNRQVTLIGGIGIERREADRLHGAELSGSRWSSALETGLGLAPLPGVTLFLRARLPVGASVAGGSLGAELLYDF